MSILADNLTDRQTVSQIESLQILRAFAFLGIFTSHCKVSSLGPWGASVFFVLSGFLMIYRYLTKEIDLTFKSVISFSIKRISKLYYLHILTMIADLLIPVLFQRSTVMGEIKANYKDILLNIFLLQSWVPNGNHYFSLNAVSWFLSDCMFLYAVFPFILYLVKKVLYIKVALLYMLILYSLQILLGYCSQFIYFPQSDNFLKWFTYICPVYRLGDFCLGALLGYIWQKYQSHPKNRWAKAMGFKGTGFELVAVSLFLLSHMVYTGELKISTLTWSRFACLYLPSSLLLVWIFAGEAGMITRTLHYKWLLFIGNFSAFAYLIHQVVIHYVEWCWVLIYGKHISSFLRVLLSLVITIILSVLFRKHQEEVISRCGRDVAES